MEIAAHKDETTGKIFETQDALLAFQDEQQCARQAAAGIEAIRARLTVLRTCVVSSLDTPMNLAGLVRATYQEVLDLLEELVVLRGIKRTKQQRKSKIDVVDVQATGFSFSPATRFGISPGAAVECSLTVRLTNQAYAKLFCDEMPDLGMNTVLSGARTISGSSWDEELDGTYCMRYNLRIALSHAPLLHARVAKLVEASEAKAKYENALERAQYSARKTNPAVLAIEEELELAQAVVDQAEAARALVQAKLTDVCLGLMSEVAQAMPFEHQPALDEALDGFQKVDAEWQYMKNCL